MLSIAARSRLSVLLVGARNPQNIGAAARAMHDFGFSDLRLVNDYTAPFEAAQLEAVNSAVHSQHVLRTARAFSTLPEAIADCTLVVGTTAIGDRALVHPVRPLAEAAPGIVAALSDAPEARVALLFGSEKTGLTTEQLSFCQALITVPMYEPVASAGGETTPRHLSMNLGQSVAVCLYELSREGFEGAKTIPQQAGIPATAEDRERLTQLLLDVMHITAYDRRFPANSREQVVRRLTHQLGGSPEEAAMWMGLLRHILRNFEEKT